MDSLKKALNKGFDKATNVNNEPQVLNKSSSRDHHALNDRRSSSLTGGTGGTGTGTDHHLDMEKPHVAHDPSRSAGTTGALGVGTSGTNPASR
ncbi:hypothetical protein QBC32DRAFT_386314 [Pseudoneurospora amorphoporcata]|uniref:Uncharacterized protein n=1 Tax=Pseudoneurospora amorphoporcata TaxID=241081 RepID=A0AAN6SHX3_9PEZI|nr:hypothetical protein QBC32DRAFT_386314 [Pseudoneurospora amorphoporcata]